MPSDDWKVTNCPECKDRGRRLMALVTLSWETQPYLYKLRRLLREGPDAD